jgi:sugar-specific transcriptional regulator TrmB
MKKATKKVVKARGWQAAAITAAVSKKPMTGAEIAAKAGINNVARVYSHLRSMVEKKLAKHKDVGYVLAK